MSNDTDDEEEESSLVGSPISSDKTATSPPLPPRRLSPIPAPNSHIRNSNVFAPKELTPSITVVLSTNENNPNNKGIIYILSRH